MCEFIRVPGFVRVEIVCSWARLEMYSSDRLSRSFVWTLCATEATSALLISDAVAVHVAAIARFSPKIPW
jgi:hypothetical protein